jgi:GNAT superfamily N-acetyltransferase
MTLNLRQYELRDAEEVATLSLLAWEPVFRSFEQVLGSTIYLQIFPDWKVSQRAAVLEHCINERMETWVAEVDGMVVGFILWELNLEDLSGEVQMLAVHPEYQNRGIGAQLNEFALEQLKAAGMKLAVVGTGGDPGHAPARRSYEKAGYTPLPQVRYYKAL